MKIVKESWSAHVLTLFPEMFPGPLGLSIIGKALRKKIWSLKLINLRNYSNNGPKDVDDAPYGGGSGMLIKSDVVHNAIKDTTKNLNSFSLVYFTLLGSHLTSGTSSSLSIICIGEPSGIFLIGSSISNINCLK